MGTLRTNTKQLLSGEYVICWDTNKNVFFGPEQFYGTLLCPQSFYYSNLLSEVEVYISTNNLILPEVDSNLK